MYGASLAVGFCYLCWQLWKTKNKLVFDHSPMIPTPTIRLLGVTHAKHMANEIKQAHLVGPCPTQPSVSRPFYWIPLPLGIYIVNCDCFKSKKRWHWYSNMKQDWGGYVLP